MQGTHAPLGAPFLITANGHVHAQDDDNKSCIGRIAQGNGHDGRKAEDVEDGAEALPEQDLPGRDLTLEGKNILPAGVQPTQGFGLWKPLVAGAQGVKYSLTIKRMPFSRRNWAGGLANH